MHSARRRTLFPVLLRQPFCGNEPDALIAGDRTNAPLSPAALPLERSDEAWSGDRPARRGTAIS